MGRTCIILLLLMIITTHAADPDDFIDWTVTYKDVFLFGKPQRVIAINGQFPGPPINTITNHNLHVNVKNQIDEPLLITWNGIQQRKSSWQDGVWGTNCPILPGQNWTYNFQAKDQIGTFFYYPSINFQRAAGGYGGFQIANRPVISVPFPLPPDSNDITILIGDWYTRDFKKSRKRLNNGLGLGRPAGVLINGKGPYSPGTNEAFETITVIPGQVYRFRISNVGTCSSLNFRIQGHKLFLVETEGSYTNQTWYDSLDIHVGQSYSVLVKADQRPCDYYIVASTKFSSRVLNGVGILHYQNSACQASGPLPSGPDPNDYQFSLNQALTIRWNLTAGAARPNPQGSYKYGKVNVTKTLLLANSPVTLNNQPRYAVNGLSYINPDTPNKLADFFNIPGVFTLWNNPNPSDPPRLGTQVLPIDYKGFVEIIFINPENEVQVWHMDGLAFWVVGYGVGETWRPSSRVRYNLVDAISRSTVQVYPGGWTAILFAVDNVGIWNVRSQCLRRQYLGQEFYIRVLNPENSTRTETWIPKNTILCGKASTRTIPGPRLNNLDISD